MRRAGRAAASHGMSGTFHAVHIAADPSIAIAGSKQKSAEPSSRRSAGRSSSSQHRHTCGLVDHVHGEARVACDHRSLDTRLGPVPGEPPHRSTGDGVQPQVATDGGVDDAGTVGEPVEAPTTEPAAGGRHRQRREHAFRPTVGRDDDDRRRAAHRGDERDPRTVWRQLRFGELASGDAHRRCHDVLASVRAGGHHAEDTGNMSHITRLHRLPSAATMRTPRPERRCTDDDELCQCRSPHRRARRLWPHRLTLVAPGISSARVSPGRIKHP